jgi:hypothetical protein
MTPEQPTEAEIAKVEAWKAHQIKKTAIEAAIKVYEQAAPSTLGMYRFAGIDETWPPKALLGLILEARRCSKF